MRPAPYVFLAILLLLAGCKDRVLPGIGFGPDGRIIELRAEDLQAQAAMVLEEQLNQRLDLDWFAEARLLDLPVEDPELPYRERWSWTRATVLVTIVGRAGAGAPPLSLASLEQVATDVMARATEAREGVTVRIHQELLDEAAFDDRRPSWIKGLHLRDG